LEPSLQKSILELSKKSKVQEWPSLAMLDLKSKDEEQKKVEEKDRFLIIFCPGTLKQKKKKRTGS